MGGERTTGWRGSLATTSSSIAASGDGRGTISSCEQSRRLPPGCFVAGSAIISDAIAPVGFLVFCKGDSIMVLLYTSNVVE